MFETFTPFDGLTLPASAAVMNDAILGGGPTTVTLQTPVPFGSYIVGTAITVTDVLGLTEIVSPSAVQTANNGRVLVGFTATFANLHAPARALSWRPPHPYEGFPYILPDQDRASFKPQIDFDKDSAAFQTLAGGIGSYIVTGRRMLNPSGARHEQAIFDLSHGCLERLGYTANRAGAAQALLDLTLSLIQGGLGRLLWRPDDMDTPPVGVSGAPIFYATAECLVRGTPQVSELSNDYNQVTTNLEFADPMWYASDGHAYLLSAFR